MSNDKLSEFIEKIYVARSNKSAANFIEIISLHHSTLSEINKYFWLTVEDTIKNCINKGIAQILFSVDERLLIDAGWFDDKLLGQNIKNLKNKIIKELYLDDNKYSGIYYLTEWLIERFKSHSVMKQFQGKLERRKKTYFETPELTQLKNMRATILKTIAPLFANLPGIPSNLSNIIPAGTLDNSIEQLSIQHYYSGKQEIKEQRDKLLEIKRKIIFKVTQASLDIKSIKLLDAFKRVDEKINSLFFNELHRGSFTLNPSAQSKETQKQNSAESIREAIIYISSELNLIKSLLGLGIADAGITKTYSFLFTDAERMTKPEVKNIIDSLVECDTGLPGMPNMLIAPFYGNGFFEWDRDTIFIPIIPTRSKEDSIVSAIGNYRILMDTLREKQVLKKQYEALFPTKNFRNSFMKDYKNWILGIGKGFRGALDNNRYNFFKKHIGPKPEMLFAPKAFTHLSPAEQISQKKLLTELINSGQGTHLEFYQLAAIYWREGRPKDTYNELKTAVKLNPTNGRILLSLAYILNAIGKKKKAKATYQSCIDLAPNSIWQVYAIEELKKAD